MRDRRHLRARLLILGIVPALVVTGFAAKTAHLLHNAETGTSALGADDADAARRAYAATGRFNLVEPWVAPYNEGIAAYFQDRPGHADAAVDLFTEALRLAPPAHECRVRTNLAIAIEAQGDDDLKTELEKARDQWYEARATLIVCLPDDPDDALPDDRDVDEAREAMTPAEAEALIEVDARLSEKLTELEETLEPDPDTPFQGKDAEFDDLTPIEQEELLELRNQEARRVRKKEREATPLEPTATPTPTDPADPADPDSSDPPPPEGPIYNW